MQVEGIDVEMQKVSFLPFLIQLMSAPPSLLWASLEFNAMPFFAFLILLSLLRQMKMEGAQLRLIIAPQQVQNTLHTGWLEVEYTAETSTSRQTSINLTSMWTNTQWLSSKYSLKSISLLCLMFDCFKIRIGPLNLM